MTTSSDPIENEERTRQALRGIKQMFAKGQQKSLSKIRSHCEA